jgi:hypothetical protein
MLSTTKHEASAACRSTADAKPETETTTEATEENSRHEQETDMSPADNILDDDDYVDDDEDQHRINPFHDDDSAYGGDDFASETVSLSSDVLKYRHENGRTYHSYGT